MYFVTLATMPASLPLATSMEKIYIKIQIKISWCNLGDQKLHRYHADNSTNPLISMQIHESTASLAGRRFALARRIFMCLHKFFISFARSATQASFYADLIYGREIFLAIKLREIEKNPLRGRVPPYPWG